jgi:putative DNA primase/helicase
VRPACLRGALEYADAGWAVFPLNGKKPYPGTGGFHDATLDAREIRAWWREWPRANVAVRCSSHDEGPIVIDLDKANPKKHEHPADELIPTLDLPDTREASSRPGRKHLYFKPLDPARPVPRTIRVKLNGVKYAVDVLGDGGYVVAPPSIHPVTGRPYRWLNDRRPVPAPSVVLELVQRHDDHGGAPPLPDVIQEGERDQLLTSLAGSMRRRGASEGAILAALREENDQRVDPPLPDSQVRKIARSIARKPPAGLGEHYSDLGNARRFVKQYHDDVRSLPTQKRPFLIWDGTRWAPDETGEVERYAKNTVRSLYTEAAHVPDDEDRDRLLKHANKSESAGRIRSLLELAATEPELAMTPDQFDADPWLLNLENGTVDLRTGELRSHRKEDLITKLAPVEYRPKARAPRWLEFLDQVTAGDPAVVAYLQRALGYSLTGDMREQCLFFCYGTGENGKGTLLNTVRELLGSYAMQADFNTFLMRRGEGPRNDLARMRGMRFVTASEASGERGFDTQVLKSMTGEDAITARFLYQELFEYDPSHKLWLAANHKPHVPEQTPAIWRRIRLIPFTKRFDKSKDKQLREKLRRELPGILNWCLAGARAWLAEGLGEPVAVLKATKEYREETDPFNEFIAQRAKLDPESWTSNVNLYNAFVSWWQETRGAAGYKPMPPNAFGRALSERAELRAVKRGGTRGWRGLALKLEIVS